MSHIQYMIHGPHTSQHVPIESLPSENSLAHGEFSREYSIHACREQRHAAEPFFVLMEHIPPSATTSQQNAGHVADQPSMHHASTPHPSRARGHRSSGPARPTARKNGEKSSPQAHARPRALIALAHGSKQREGGGISQRARSFAKCVKMMQNVSK